MSDVISVKSFFLALAVLIRIFFNQKNVRKNKNERRFLRLVTPPINKVRVEGWLKAGVVNKFKV